MKMKLDESVAEEKIVHITTYDTDGTFGTVAMWFLYMSGRIFMSTDSNSLKVRRIAKNQRVALQFRSRTAPIVEGTAGITKERKTIRKASEGLFAKYDGKGEWWESVEHMVEGFIKGSPSVLLEIVPDTP